jgi:hypothetical protein
MRISGRTQWYDLVILALAVAIVYPDKILEWIGDRTGWSWGWRHLVIFEVAMIALVCLLMFWLMPLYPRLTWMTPMVCVGMVAFFRFLVWFIMDMTGLTKW